MTKLIDFIPWPKHDNRDIAHVRSWFFIDTSAGYGINNNAKSVHELSKNKSTIGRSDISFTPFLFTGIIRTRERCVVFSPFGYELR